MDLSLLHQIPICGTHFLLQLCQFCTQLQDKPAHKDSYQASIKGLSLRLPKLQEENTQAQRVWTVLWELGGKQGLKKGSEDVNKILH